MFFPQIQWHPDDKLYGAYEKQSKKSRHGLKAVFTVYPPISLRIFRHLLKTLWLEGPTDSQKSYTPENKGGTWKKPVATSIYKTSICVFEPFVFGVQTNQYSKTLIYLPGN